MSESKKTRVVIFALSLSGFGPLFAEEGGVVDKIAGMSHIVQQQGDALLGVLKKLVEAERNVQLNSAELAEHAQRIACLEQESEKTVARKAVEDLAGGSKECGKLVKDGVVHTGKVLTDAAKGVCTGAKNVACYAGREVRAGLVWFKELFWDVTDGEISEKTRDDFRELSGDAGRLVSRHKASLGIITALLAVYVAHQVGLFDAVHDAVWGDDEEDEVSA